ncbi:hypothetical protein FIBSPDRAFT_861730 [Athelia psychrophila]|uniref:Uncharacterized protein n=1 Tax=Athelia psychrophila TaxID=1759441 RepID=A0A166J386_9AGAM|nr:hypothetical protein FIBSPDRAFT_861730 [Fibularhizoctonia sp. CBS 109695]
MQPLPCNIASSSSSHPYNHITASTSPDTTYWPICFHEARVPMVPRMLCIGHVKAYGVSEICLMDDQHVDQQNGCEECSYCSCAFSEIKYSI